MRRILWRQLGTRLRPSGNSQPWGAAPSRVGDESFSLPTTHSSAWALGDETTFFTFCECHIPTQPSKPNAITAISKGYWRYFQALSCKQDLSITHGSASPFMSWLHFYSMVGLCVSRTASSSSHFWNVGRDEGRRDFLLAFPANVTATVLSSLWLSSRSPHCFREASYF